MRGNLLCVEFSFELLRIYCALRAKEDDWEILECVETAVRQRFRFSCST